MTFTEPPSDEVIGLFGGMLAAESCTACHTAIKRRRHRVYIRATWQDGRDVLCPQCWNVICSWARRFVLDQLALDL